MDKKDFIGKKEFDNYAKSLRVQKDQIEKSKDELSKFDRALNDLENINKSNSEDLDKLLAKSNKLLEENAPFPIKDKIEKKELSLSREERLNIEAKLASYDFKRIDIVEAEEDWDSYLDNVISYGESNSLSLNDDPFSQLMSQEDQELILSRMEADYKMVSPNCDKYDYFLASLSGLIAGFIDVVFVGSSLKGEKGSLSLKADEFVKKASMDFSDFVYKMEKGKSGSSRKESTKIQYLEEVFKVPYDATSDRILGLEPKTLKMNTMNHHYVSLAHSPGLGGLFFSILDQFTNSGTYFSNGKIIREAYSTKNPFILKGNNFLEKCFYGFVNWFGHNMSDIAGSSDSVAKSNRGTGLPIPLTQFFQAFDNVRLAAFNNNDLAKIARTVFEQGYDFRHSMALAIPVVFNELVIRFLWAVKRYYYHGDSLESILKTKNSAELRRMLLIGHGSLCMVDGFDALLRFGGLNYVSLFSRMNLLAWTRFSYAAFKEVRAIYGNSIDYDARNKDMDKEWERIFLESKAYI